MTRKQLATILFTFAALVVPIPTKQSPHVISASEQDDFGFSTLLYFQPCIAGFAEVNSAQDEMTEENSSKG